MSLRMALLQARQVIMVGGAMRSSESEFKT